jgi:glycine cleavage system H protein
MSILFVLLTFLLCITISYLMSPRREVFRGEQPEFLAVPPGPQMVRSHGFEIPAKYAFHLGHTWALDEGRQNARVGLDKFAANLLGKIDRVEVTGLGRWVRQGQKLMTITRDNLKVEVVSPVEGVVMAANPKVLKNPSLVMQDPYGEGWILAIQSPDLLTNLRNLVRGTFVMPWMKENLNTLRSLVSPALPATAQDGGLPVVGLLSQVEPQLQRRLIKEFFLT